MTLVWVALLSINTTIINDVFECIIHQTTATAFISLRFYRIKIFKRMRIDLGQILGNSLARTIHEILFRERDQFPSCIEVLSLQRSSGAESPAGTTLTLGQQHSYITEIAIIVPESLLPDS